MKYSDVRNLLKTAGLSPEQLGEASGISGMTIRRWLKQPGSEAVPRAYAVALKNAGYTLAISGKVSLGDPSIQAILAEDENLQGQAVLAHLGLQGTDFRLDDSPENLLVCLNQIGVQPQKQKEVDEGQKKISSFKKMGDEWARRISILHEVVRSTKLRSLDKLVAYGALFYLLTPFDLIPDQIPVLGFMDDFIVLGIAAAYYTSKLGALNQRPNS